MSTIPGPGARGAGRAKPGHAGAGGPGTAPGGDAANTAGAAPPGSAQDAARRMRRILADPSFKTEGHRKAALRRVLHAGAAGMTEPELSLFLDEIKSRFPDRTFESTIRLRHLEEKSAAMEKENAELRKKVEALERRAKDGDTTISALVKTASRAAAHAAGESEVGGSIFSPADAEALQRFSAAIAKIMTFAFDQEATLASVEETLGRPGRKGAQGESLAGILVELARASGRPGDLDMEMETRLRRLHLLPAALLAGAQQSWKGGTRGLLEYLDPKVVEQEIQGKIPGLREAAVLKEVRRRYEQLWDELDKNIAHYYRGTFETVYSEKMEGRK